MKTLVLNVHASQLYGAARSAFEHARLLRSTGVNTVMLLREHGALESLCAQEGIPCLVYPIAHHGLRRFWRQSGPLRKLLAVIRSRVDLVVGTARLLRREDAPLLHVHSAYCIYEALGARLVRAPLVWHVREEKGRGFGWWLRDLRMRMLADAVVFVSGGIRAGYRWCRPLARTLYNFVEIPAVCAPPEVSGPLTILFAGAIVREKGVLDAAAILGELKRRHVAFRAIFAGDGPPEARTELLSCLRREGVEARVKLIGYTTNMGALYASADVLLLPSHSDSLPRVVMEAMASGLPVVATRVGGIPEMVADGATGFLFEPGQPLEAAKALETLARDPSRRREMGVAGRTRAEKLFSQERYLEEVARIYADVMSARNQP